MSLPDTKVTKDATKRGLAHGTSSGESGQGNRGWTGWTRPNVIGHGEVKNGSNSNTAVGFPLRKGQYCHRD